MDKNENVYSDHLGLSGFNHFLVRTHWSQMDARSGPRFLKVHQTLINVFKEKNIDYITAVCNAAGLPAYPFHREQMAPFSKELAGIDLPHDSFGTHWDANGKTVDPEKKLKNFKKAG